jgi:hypothetical protein
MSTTYERPPVAELRHALTALRGNWLWFVLLGSGAPHAAALRGGLIAT